MSTNPKALEQFVINVIEIYNDIDKSLGLNYEFNADEFNKQITTLATKLKSETTKFSIAFKPPVVEENEAACKSYLEPLVQLSIIAKSIPNNQGQNFIKEIKRLSKNVIKSIINLGNSFLVKPILHDEEFNIENVSLDEQDYFPLTGLVWNACDKLKSAPKDNRDAVMNKWKDTIELVKDAIEEIQELKEESEYIAGQSDDGEEEEKDLADEFAELHFGLDDEPFEEKEKLVIKNCLNILKLIEILMVKISKSCINECSTKIEGAINWLDEMVDLANKVTDTIDALGTVLWDRDQEEIEANARELVGLIKTLINQAKLFCKQVHHAWFDNCEAKFDKLTHEISDDATTD